MIQPDRAVAQLLHHARGMRDTEKRLTAIAKLENLLETLGLESRVADDPWRIDYYGAPTRNWGFNALFSSGTYPPGTPLLRTYRRVNFKFMSKADWDSPKPLGTSDL